MITKQINDKTVQYFCIACGHDHGTYRIGVKPYLNNSVTGIIEHCIKCGHRFGDSPWVESERPV